MILLWQLGVVDTFTLWHLGTNFLFQYGTIVGPELIGNMSQIAPSAFFAPIAGLGTSYKYVRAAQGAYERRQRIAQLATLMSSSVTMLTTDPQTNIGMGALIAAYIAHMKSILEKTNTTGSVSTKLFY